MLTENKVSPDQVPKQVMALEVKAGDGEDVASTSVLP